MLSMEGRELGGALALRVVVIATSPVSSRVASSHDGFVALLMSLITIYLFTPGIW